MAQNAVSAPQANHGALILAQVQYRARRGTPPDSERVAGGHSDISLWVLVPPPHGS